MSFLSPCLCLSDNFTVYCTSCTQHNHTIKFLFPPTRVLPVCHELFIFPTALYILLHLLKFFTRLVHAVLLYLLNFTLYMCMFV